MKRPSSAARETAEMLAIQAFSFIAEEPERLNGLLSATGLTLDRLRESANQPDFLGGHSTFDFHSGISIQRWRDGTAADETAANGAYFPGTLYTSPGQKAFLKNLKKYDPTGYKLMQDVWGQPRDGAAPSRKR